MLSSLFKPVASAEQLDGFLASVEKQAFVMARSATGDPDAALDVVQDSMLKLVQQYRSKPAEEWRPLFFRILHNRITDQHRKRGFVQRMSQWFATDSDSDESVDTVDLLASTEPEPDEYLHADGVGDALHAAYLHLPQRQQQVFNLRQW